MPSSSDLGLEDVIAMARAKAHEAERVSAEQFLDSLAQTSGDLSDLPLQLSVFHNHVEPLLDNSAKRKVAYFLVDAFRYEMGCDLAEALGSNSDTGSVSVELALSTPPTITRVGMAALMPGASEGVELIESSGKVVPRVAGTLLSGLPERSHLLSDRYGERVNELTLEECLSKKQKKLDEITRATDLLLIRSQDIDAIGEQDDIHRARSFISRIISDLQRAIGRLARAGIEEFVITADHGYLLREDISDAMKIDPPDGVLLEVHRRCAIGRDLGRGDHHIVFRTSDLGLGGDLELAFPRGINVFRVIGNTVYFHGGLSLQELVIPVIHYTPARKAERALPTVELVVELAKVTTPFFQVELRYHAAGPKGQEDMFEAGRTRRFAVTVVKDGEVVGQTAGASRGYVEAGNEVELNPGESSVLMLQLVGDVEGRGSFEIEATDVRTGDPIQRKKVAYEFLF